MTGTPGFLRDAEAQCRAAVGANPQAPEAHTALGRALQAQDRLEEALACYAAARALAPQVAAYQVNEGDALLLLGRYREAWPHFERRMHLPANRAAHPAQRIWNGESLEGRTILIHGVQDVRDAIQFLRYVPLLAQQARNVVLAVPRELIRVAASLPIGNLQVVREDVPVPSVDVTCPLICLPRLFKTEPGAIPGRVPYLTPRGALVERWSHTIGGAGRLKVGIALGERKDRVHVPAPAQIESLFDIAGIDWINLQSGEPAVELGRRALVTDLSDQLTDLSELAAAALNLDLVVTVDDVLAHLAGAMGRPAWIMLPFAPAWRWMRAREDCPWYPSLRLYRQPEPGQWDPVVARIAQALARLADRHARRTDGRR